jgi:hypothetical protein
MKQIVANIWDVYRDYDAICCTTNYIVKGNGELVMGAGVAKEFAKKYPWLPKNWGERVGRNWKANCHPGVFVTLMRQKPHLVYFGTKWDWNDYSDINLIEASAQGLCMFADMVDWKNVLLPRPGCSNGCLTWEEVEARIKPWLDDRFTIIRK